MGTTTTILKERAVTLIQTATTMEDVAYLIKGLASTNQIDETVGDVTYKKVDELAPTSSAKDIAYILKALENTVVYSSDKYQIGVPGEIGFGVATCPPNLLPAGWTGLLGHDVIGSQNYGNYQDVNGSILVYVPKHYYMYVGNEIYISQRHEPGYVLDRSFVNAGAEKNGVFIYKYGASNLNGIFGSQKFADPLSTNAAHNPISALNNIPANNCGGLYKAVKSAGSNYFLTSIFNYSMLARLALAHGKAATSIAASAYIDVAPLMPKGCLVSALKDVNDASVTYDASGYSNCGLTGSGSPFSKTTHNGQNCGIADLNGNMWEVASGFTLIETTAGSPAPTDFRILLESTDITAILDDTTTAGTGAYDMALYEQIDFTGIVDANDGWTYLGNGTNAVFAMSINRTTADYKKTALGIPTSTGVSASGTTEFGNDGLYRYLRNEMACLVGAYWGSSSYAGIFSVNLYKYRTNPFDGAGGRASYLV